MNQQQQCKNIVNAGSYIDRTETKVKQVCSDCQSLIIGQYIKVEKYQEDLKKYFDEFSKDVFKHYEAVKLLLQETLETWHTFIQKLTKRLNEDILSLKDDGSFKEQLCGSENSPIINLYNKYQYPNETSSDSTNQRVDSQTLEDIKNLYISIENGLTTFLSSLKSQEHIKGEEGKQIYK